MGGPTTIAASMADPTTIAAVSTAGQDWAAAVEATDADGEIDSAMEARMRPQPSFASPPCETPTFLCLSPV